MSELTPDRLSTLGELPGFDTVQALGLVYGVATAMGFSTERSADKVVSEALAQMIADAAALGANAIVGVTLNLAVPSAVVAGVSGTAVRVVPATRHVGAD